jgi:hypothetical protein
VVFKAVKGVGYGASSGVTHSADQSVAARDFVLGNFEEIDAFEAELRGPLAELFERSVFVAPAANGLVDGFASGGLPWLCRQIESGCDGGGCSGFEEDAAGRHQDRLQVAGYREWRIGYLV